MKNDVINGNVLDVSFEGANPERKRLWSSGVPQLDVNLSPVILVQFRQRNGDDARNTEDLPCM